MSDRSGIRIWYQSMIPIHRLAAYRDALQEHAARACSEGTEVVFNGSSDATYRNHTPADLLRYPYAKLVIQQEAIDFARRAEAEGFDAIILGSFSEPFLIELRSLLDIPVISMPEASLFAACSLAERFALVTLGASNVIRLRRVVRGHGLDSRVSGIHPFPRQTDEDELNAAFADPAGLIESFTAITEDAVAGGADVVIPAEGVLNEVLHANGVRSIAGATVMDCVGAAMLQAEMMVAMRRRLGLGVGRRWSYLKPPPGILAEIEAFNRQRRG